MQNIEMYWSQNLKNAYALADTINAWRRSNFKFQSTAVDYRGITADKSSITAVTPQQLTPSPRYYRRPHYRAALYCKEAWSLARCIFQPFHSLITNHYVFSVFYFMLLWLINDWLIDTKRLAFKLAVCTVYCSWMKIDRKKTPQCLQTVLLSTESSTTLICQLSTSANITLPSQLVSCGASAVPGPSVWSFELVMWRITKYGYYRLQKKLKTLLCATHHQRIRSFACIQYELMVNNEPITKNSSRIIIPWRRRSALVNRSWMIYRCGLTETDFLAVVLAETQPINHPTFITDITFSMYKHCTVYN